MVDSSADGRRGHFQDAEMGRASLLAKDFSDEPLQRLAIVSYIPANIMYHLNNGVQYLVYVMF